MTTTKRLEPYSAEWVRAWFNDPARIARALTPKERKDPRLNPLHPNATWPAGHEPGRTQRLPVKRRSRR